MLCSGCIMRQLVYEEMISQTAMSKLWMAECRSSYPAACIRVSR